MTMREWNAHIDGHKLKQEIRDEENWILGQYVLSAVSVAVEHVLAGKKAKSKYIDKPVLLQMKEQEEQNQLELTEEEKKKKAEQFFMKLKVMQTNFELEKERDSKGQE